MAFQPLSNTTASIAATLFTVVVCFYATIYFLPDHHTVSDETTRLTAIDSQYQEPKKPDFPADDRGNATAQSPTHPIQKPSESAIGSPKSNVTGQPASPGYNLTQEDWMVIQNLPPVCTDDLRRHTEPSNSNPETPSSGQSKIELVRFDQPVTGQPETQSQPITESQPIELNPPVEVEHVVEALVNRANSSPLESRQNVVQDNSYYPYASAASVPKPTHSSGFMYPGAPHSTPSKVHGNASASLGGNPSSPAERVASLSRAKSATGNPNNDEDPHAEIYSRSPFPSAKQCAQCHKQIYEEWASSSHAYASVSPMFHVFEDTINRLSQGTIGYFCYRCHSPVSTTMGLRRDQPIWDGPPVFREGVTCVACHRVKTPYGKVDGERRIEPGDIYEPVYGAGDGRGVTIADKYRQYFKVKTERTTKKLPGQAMHRRSIQFEELSKSSFCMSCHQVAVEPGIKLEVVWDQYRASPAYRDGITCQDCHMGRVPGLDEGYSVGPGAVVNERVINAEKKHSNHIFYGPGYSIAHPGVFPHHLEADRWTMPQWLEFDWRAGWGTDEFEDALADGKFTYHFPPTWAEADDRYEAREIVDENLKKLHYKRDLRRQLLENGSKLDGPFFNADVGVGRPLKFRYCLTNLNPGHNMPSGSLGAQPQIWMNVVLIDPHGNRIWESGYLDSNGDLADNHSLDVLARKIPLDTQLVNLQTKFLTTNVKGTDREMYLPVNFDFDQLPFLRPPQQPVSVINHPPFIRMEGHSIPPLGKRNAKFSIPSRLIQVPGTYRLSIRMRSRAEPIYFMRFCNATEEMQRMMNEWICDFHISTVSFEVR